MRYIGLTTEFTEIRKSAVWQIKRPPVSDRTVKGWMQRFKPQAIVCGNDYYAYMLLTTLSRIGVAVPDEIMVSGFDDVRYEERPICGLTTISQPLVDIGMTAISRLVERIRSHSLPRCSITLDAPLIVRASTTSEKFRSRKRKKERNC
jgi:DNA-binding LacI/PurR family transcriptional regulator